MMRGSYLRTFHWALILEITVMLLWVPSLYTLASLTSSATTRASLMALSTMILIGINM